MTVYADVLFLVNFSLDYVTLYITGRLLSNSSSAWRMTLSSAVGAVFAVSALVFDMKGTLYVLFSAAVTFLMCVCAYKRAGIVGYITSALLLFSVGTAIGGAVSAICSLGAGYRDALDADPYEDAVVFVVALAATVITAVSTKLAKKRCVAVKRLVKITLGEKTVELDALADSGNLARDPLSGSPVLIVRADAIKEMLSVRVYEVATSETADVTTLEARDMARVRMLPVSGVSGSGILLGYRADAVTVEDRRGKMREVSCILGLSREKNGFGGCDAILPSEFI